MGSGLGDLSLVSGRAVVALMGETDGVNSKGVDAWVLSGKSRTEKLEAGLSSGIWELVDS